jgi:hypothetical protein
VAGRVQEAIYRCGVEVGGDPRIAFDGFGERGVLDPGGVVNDLVRFAGR